jgi:hypothetical protein
MGQVADSYTAVREQRISPRPALWEDIKARLHW